MEGSSRYRVLTINSFFAYLFSYYFVMILARLASIILALADNKAPVIYYNKLWFNAPLDSWDAGAVKSIYFAEQFTCFLLAVVFFGIFFNRKKEAGYFKLVLLWLFYLSLARCFGGIVAGIITGKDFGHVAAWMYLNTNVKLFMSGALILGMIVLGYSTSNLQMATAYSGSMITPENRIRFFIHSLLYPFLLGNIVINLVNITDVQLNETLIALSGGLLLIGLIFFYRQNFFQDFGVSFNRKSMRVNRVYAVLAIVLVLVLRTAVTGIFL